MDVISHAIVANRITRGVLPRRKRLLVMIGSVLPDLDLRTQPHRGNNLLVRIFNSQHKVKSAKSDYVKAIQLGILAHYICDYYCYAHKYNLDISHGLRHMKYEFAMQGCLIKGFQTRLSRDYNKETFMNFIFDTKAFYDTRAGSITRDLEYMLTITEQAVDELIEYFRPFKKA
ncbi:MAG: zinc dependent phospholipase C family protein [Clostridia bacterium]